VHRSLFSVIGGHLYALCISVHFLIGCRFWLDQDVLLKTPCL